LAPRALRVVERRIPDHHAIKAFGATLVPTAKEFIASYDGLTQYGTKWRKEMAEGKGAVSALTEVIRTWLPRLAVDVPHFDRSTFADTAVPDDVMEDAERLRDTVEDHEALATDPANAVKPLAYATDLLGQLAPAFAAAVKEWQEAEEADRNYQQALAKTRGLAGQFQQELVAFRETLGSVVGRSDTDYQKLRTQRAATTDPEDDPTAPKPATPGAS
jgi:hypothetical protein